MAYMFELALYFTCLLYVTIIYLWLLLIWQKNAESNCSVANHMIEKKKQKGFRKSDLFSINFSMIL